VRRFQLRVRPTVVTVAGSVVIRKARELGVGTELPTDWFTEDEHP